jgi:hypothetical protein
MVKVPYYETSAGATEALLLSDSFVQSDLYTITCSFGAVLRYTTAPINIDVGGTIFYADQVLVDINSSSKGHWRVGTAADTWQVVMAPRSYDPGTNQRNPDTIGGLPFIEAAKKGVFDGADVQVDRAVLAAWPRLPASKALATGAFTMFKGLMGAVDIGRSQVALTALSYMDLLTSNSPRNVFQSGCRHTLFDAGCTLLASSFVVAGTVAAGSTQGSINSTVAAPGGSATYLLGRMKMTSGQNAGFWRGVRSWTVGTPNIIVPTCPWFFPINTGETFQIYPGCDKTTTQCTAFSNIANYGGQQKIPASTTAV